MTIHDISVPLRADLPTWPGETGMTRTIVSSQPEDPATVSQFLFGAHSGTHIDAPIHFLPDGGGIESVSLDACIGPCHVVDMRHVTDVITGDHLASAGVPDQVERMIALTRNSGWSRSTAEFSEAYVAFNMSAARWCVDRGLRLLGNDYLSIESFHADGRPVHKTLLGEGVVVLEGLDLVDVRPGEYQLIAFPIAVPGSDGAPVRAVLIED